MQAPPNPHPPQSHTHRRRRHPHALQHPSISPHARGASRVCVCVRAKGERNTVAHLAGVRSRCAACKGARGGGSSASPAPVDISRDARMLEMRWRGRKDAMQALAQERAGRHRKIWQKAGLGHRSGTAGVKMGVAVFAACLSGRRGWMFFSSRLMRHDGGCS